MNNDCTITEHKWITGTHLSNPDRRCLLGCHRTLLQDIAKQRRQALDLNPYICTNAHLFNPQEIFSLKEFLAARQNPITEESLSLSAIYRLARQIIEAVCLLHQHNLVVRTFKLENILIVEEDILLLETDAIISINDPSARKILGTVDMLAPESWKALSKGCDEYSDDTNLFAIDIWALGIIFWRLFKFQSSPPWIGKATPEDTLDPDRFKAFAKRRYRAIRTYFHAPDAAPYNVMDMLHFRPMMRITAAEGAKRMECELEDNAQFIIDPTKKAVFGGFKIGRFGTLRIAQHEEPAIRFCLKYPHLDQDRSKFEEERDRILALNHFLPFKKHLVPFLGHTYTSVFFKPCSANLYHLGRKKYPRAVLKRVAEGVLRAAEALHECHLAHRDIKAENFVVTSLNPFELMNPECVKLVDLEYVEYSDSSQRPFVGTLMYLPPEGWANLGTQSKQMPSRHSLTTGDRWALGIVLISLLDPEKRPEWIQEGLTLANSRGWTSAANAWSHYRKILDYYCQNTSFDYLGLLRFDAASRLTAKRAIINLKELA